MSWSKRSLLLTATLIAVLSVPSLADAQRGGRRIIAARPVLVAPYFSYYNPFFWGSYRWGYPGWYGPAFYDRALIDSSSARIQVTPKHTEVYVDGYLAGVVDDFDGVAQRLRVAPGEHVIELYLDGHKTIAQTILFRPGQSYRIRHAMEPLAAGEAAPNRPKPNPNAPAATPAPFDAFGRRMAGPPSGARGAYEGAPGPKEGAAIAIRVQPADATILVDGERWQSSGDRLEIQVSPGEHRIEVQKDGYQPFSTSIRIAPGQTSPVNISLTKSGEE